MRAMAWRTLWPGRLRDGLLILALATVPQALGAGLGIAETAPQSLAAGETAPEIHALAQALQLDRLAGVLQAEGLDYGRLLDADLLAGRGGAGWTAAVGRIYAPDRLRRDFRHLLSQELAADPLVPDMLAFLQSDLGRQIVTSELEARQAMLEPARKDKSRLAWMALAQDNPRRAGQIVEFVRLNDLMEGNVAGGMNANLAFYQGLAMTAPPALRLPEEDLLAAVAGQEQAIRAETEAWLYPYLVMAYDPLEDAGLDAYLAFCETPAGRRLNSALFAVFNGLFARVSAEMGREAGLVLRGQEI